MVFGRNGLMCTAVNDYASRPTHYVPTIGLGMFMHEDANVCWYARECQGGALLRWHSAAAAAARRLVAEQ